MRARILVAVAVVLCASGTLTACRSHVGVAADVNGQEISESTVARHVRPGGSANDTTHDSTSTLPPRSEVLQTLVLERIYERALAANGGIPSVGRLAGYHDKAAQAVLQTTQRGVNLDRTIADGLAALGVEREFARTIVRSYELQYALIDRLGLEQFPDLRSALTAAVLAGREAARGASLPGATKEQLAQAAAQILSALAQALETRLRAATTPVDVTATVDAGFSDALRGIGVNPVAINQAAQEFFRRMITAVSQTLARVEYPGVGQSIRKIGVSVSVSARYGKWDSKTLSLDPHGNQPDYLDAADPSGSTSVTPTNSR